MVSKPDQRARAENHGEYDEQSRGVVAMPVCDEDSQQCHEPGDDPESAPEGSRSPLVVVPRAFRVANTAPPCSTITKASASRCQGGEAFLWGKDVTGGRLRAQSLTGAGSSGRTRPWPTGGAPSTRDLGATPQSPGLGRRAVVRTHNVSGWKCVSGAVPVADGNIDVWRQCRVQYRRTNAYGGFKNYNDPYS